MSKGKRAFDVLASGTALVLLSPLMAMIALAVWALSGLPIFFGQERVGRRFRPFTLWKFRTMRQAAGPLVTAAGDKRITPLGKFLRRAKLDELPQLWNVVRGDMSLVGPRPEVRRYVELYRLQYERLLSVPPGITDPATIEFRDEETVLATSPDPERAYTELVLPAKLRLSEDYVARCSMWRDISILLRTVLVVAGIRLTRGRFVAHESVPPVAAETNGNAWPGIHMESRRA